MDVHSEIRHYINEFKVKDTRLSKSINTRKWHTLKHLKKKKLFDTGVKVIDSSLLKM